MTWCRWPDSNRHGLLARWILSPLRLPIPSHRQIALAIIIILGKEEKSKLFFPFLGRWRQANKNLAPKPEKLARPQLKRPLGNALWLGQKLDGFSPARPPWPTTYNLDILSRIVEKPGRICYNQKHRTYSALSLGKNILTQLARPRSPKLSPCRAWPPKGHLQKPGKRAGKSHRERMKANL